MIPEPQEVQSPPWEGSKGNKKPGREGGDLPEMVLEETHIRTWSIQVQFCRQVSAWLAQLKSQQLKTGVE